MLLNSWVIVRSPTSDSSCKTLPVMRSYPGDLVGHSLFIAVQTSVSLNVRTGVCGRPREARASKIAHSSVSDISEGYGLEMFSKCLASRLAFCMSLFTHSPPLVHKGGMGVCGCFRHLVAFHTE